MLNIFSESSINTHSLLGKISHAFLLAFIPFLLVEYVFSLNLKFVFSTTVPKLAFVVTILSFFYLCLLFFSRSRLCFSGS